MLFLRPSHVSVIGGSKIYEEFPRDYNKPVVVSGFEPVDDAISLYDSKTVCRKKK